MIKKIELDMSDQLQDAIDSFGEKIEGYAVTLARSNLFFVDETSELLDNTRKEIFHRVTEKLLYI